MSDGMSANARRAAVFGELRSLLARAPSPQGWRALVAQLDALDDDDDLPWLCEVALPYCDEGLTGWPEHMRIAPTRWMSRLSVGEDEPRVSLARRFELDDWPQPTSDPWHQLVTLWASPRLRLSPDACWQALVSMICEAMVMSMPFGEYTIVAEPLPEAQEALPDEQLCSRLGDVSSTWRHYDWRQGVEDWMAWWLFDEIAEAYELRPQVFALFADALEGWLGPIDTAVQVSHDAWEGGNMALGVEAASGARVYLYLVVAR